MANIKISQMTAAASASGTQEYEVNDGGVTKKVTGDQIKTLAVAGAYADVTTLGTVEASKFVTADANGDVKFPDGEKIFLGTGGDLELYHDGANSYITESGTGNLRLQADNFYVLNAAGNATSFESVAGVATLFYSNNPKLATTSTGVDVTGEFIADSYNETYAALSGTHPAVDCHNGNVFALSTQGNTTFTFTNPPASGTAYGFTLKVTATGTHTLTWPSSVDWAGGTAPDAPASGETNVLVFITHDGGTTWYGFQGGAAMA